MREVTKVTEMIESEAGFCFDMLSFLIRWVTTGYETESEIGLYKNGKCSLAFDLVTLRDLAH